MEIDLVLPSTPTLTLPPTLNVPPDIPHDPSISLLFPENTPYRVADNPFRGSISKELSESHKKALKDALTSIRGPFNFDTDESYTFNGEYVGTDITAESFDSAANTVIAALERGYYPNRDSTPLGPSDWARLSCALLAAVGRGYHRQAITNQEAALEKARAGTTDPKPLNSAHPTFFHRLHVTAEEIASHLGADISEETESYQDWYSTLKNEFTVKVTKAAAAEVDEKWLTWKANEIDRLAATYKKEMGIKARERSTKYFIQTADTLGLQFIGEGPPKVNPPPTTGRKRTASGSAPTPSQSAVNTPRAMTIPLPTPQPAPPASVTPKATRVNPPRAAKRVTSASPTPRGREPTPASQRTTRVDPSSTPHPRKKAPAPQPVLRTDPEEGRPPQMPPRRTAGAPEQPDAATLTASVLTKILARLEALERFSMPPPVRSPEVQNGPAQAPYKPWEDAGTRNNREAPHGPQPTVVEEGDFTLVARNE